jgi:5-hydroxyisourate hydrolase
VTISTHVLDTSAGRPAAGIPVRLERQDGDAWIEVSQAATNEDGRVAEFLPPSADAAAGSYRLLFDVAPYFARRGVESFYREISVAFIVRDAAAHFHVPLLLSPFAYSTYRGS